MTEETPFSPFTPTAPVEPPAREKRGPRRQAKPRAAEPAAPKPPKAAKPERKRSAPKARTLQIPISVLPEIKGFNENELSMFISIMGNLQDVGKKARGRIVMALGKLFK